MCVQRSLKRALFSCMSRQSSWDCNDISLPGAVYIDLTSLGKHLVAVSGGLKARLAMVRKVWTCGGADF